MYSVDVNEVPIWLQTAGRASICCASGLAAHSMPPGVSYCRLQVVASHEADARRASAYTATSVAEQVEPAPQARAF